MSTDKDTNYVKRATDARAIVALLIFVMLAMILFGVMRGEQAQIWTNGTTL